jgi:hypothetical protein
MLTSGHALQLLPMQLFNSTAVYGKLLLHRNRCAGGMHNCADTVILASIIKDWCNTYCMLLLAVHTPYLA